MSNTSNHEIEPQQYLLGLEMTIDTERAIHEETAYQATHDTLTGALNVGGLYETLAKIDAAGAEVAVLVVDGDNIKNINSNLGYDAGDEAIIGTADTLRACIRPEDVVARVGGDEFIVLLLGSAREGAAPTPLEEIIDVTLKRIPKCLKSFQLDNPELKKSGFGLSIGAAIHRPGDDFKNTKKVAEAKMSENKNRLNGEMTEEKELVLKSLAELAMQAGISRRELANYLRTDSE